MLVSVRSGSSVVKFLRFVLLVVDSIWWVLNVVV